MPSSDYYHNSSQTLPPLRSVLGDQLDLPFAHQNFQSPYNLCEIYKALPPASGGGFADPRNAARPSSIDATHMTTHQRLDYSPPHRPFTYPPPSPPASFQLRTASPNYDPEDHPSHVPPHPPSTSSKSSSSRKYACTWEGCDKRFERQHALDTHMNIHLEQKPFACPVPHCGKVFNVRSNMRRHLNIHKDVQLHGHFENEDDAEDSVRMGGNSHTRRRYSQPEVLRLSSEDRRLTGFTHSKFPSTRKT